jgi:hypothetical protein
LWQRLKFIIKNDSDRNRVKRQILRVANININKLVSILDVIAEPINLYSDLSNDMITPSFVLHKNALILSSQQSYKSKILFLILFRTFAINLLFVGYYI